MILRRLVSILESSCIYIFVVSLFNISKQYIPQKTRKSCARMFCPLPQSFRSKVASRCVTRANLKMMSWVTLTILCDGDNNMWFCLSLAQPLLQRHRQDFLSCKMVLRQVRNHNLDVPPRLTRNTCTNRSFKKMRSQSEHVAIIIYHPYQCRRQTTTNKSTVNLVPS